MRIKDRFMRVKSVAAAIVDFTKRHPRASIAVAVALLIIGPLLTGAGGESFFLNLVGLAIVALVVQRVMRAYDRRQAAQARQANCRCRCHCQQQSANHQP